MFVLSDFLYFHFLLEVSCIRLFIYTQKKVNLQIILKELKYNEHLQSFSSLSCFLAFFSSFLQTITGAQTDHYARQADMISLCLPFSLTCTKTQHTAPPLPLLVNEIGSAEETEV